MHSAQGQSKSVDGALLYSTVHPDYISLLQRILRICASRPTHRSLTEYTLVHHWSSTRPPSPFPPLSPTVQTSFAHLHPARSRSLFAAVISHRAGNALHRESRHETAPINPFVLVPSKTGRGSVLVSGDGIDIQFPLLSVVTIPW
jgi:hypothetical protein